MSSATATAEALHVIETLRSGVPSRRVAALLGTGREPIVERVLQDLGDAAAAGATRGCFLKGEYGEGKTHLLNQLEYLAGARNYVVSQVALSKETPFHDPARVYQKLAAAIRLPRTPHLGLEPLLSRLDPNGQTADALVAYARERLHAKLPVLLECYFQTPDEYHRHLLLADLQGNHLPLTQLKAIYRINFGSAARIERFTREHIWDYIKLLRRLFQLQGYAGWLILFDEVELVGKLSARSRAAAYYRMSQFLGLEPAGTGQGSVVISDAGQAASGAAASAAASGQPPEASSDAEQVAGGTAAPLLRGTYTVLAVASSFYTDVLDRKLDLDEAPQRLPSSVPSNAGPAVRAVLDQAVRGLELPQIGDDAVRAILRRIEAAHGAAYQWDARLDAPRVLEQTWGLRLRTKLRAAIEYLDLKYQYGGEPDYGARSLDETRLAEDEAFFEETVEAGREAREA